MLTGLPQATPEPRRSLLVVVWTWTIGLVRKKGHEHPDMEDSPHRHQGPFYHLTAFRPIPRNCPRFPSLPPLMPSVAAAWPPLTRLYAARAAWSTLAWARLSSTSWGCPSALCAPRLGIWAICSLHGHKRLLWQNTALDIQSRDDLKAGPRGNQVVFGFSFFPEPMHPPRPLLPRRGLKMYTQNNMASVRSSMLDVPSSCPTGIRNQGLESQSSSTHCARVTHAVGEEPSPQ